jgi:hypothetical protein
MQKRKIIIGDYDTAAYGWTLAGWTLSGAEPKTNYIEKPSGDGSWDLSTALTDGVVKYKDRELTITLECSEGTRLEREEVIRRMVNQLDGLRWEIRLPDDDLHYIVGRVRVIREYNDMAHAAVAVTAVCEPWKYSNTETVVVLTAATAKQTTQVINNGRRVIVPTLTVTGNGASVLLEYGTASMALSAGTYKWPNLLLTTGSHALTYSGSGKVVVSYREAVLE